MRGSELLKLLSDNGCYLEKHGRGHDRWYSPITGKKFIVPRHSKEVPTGTANSILKDAGLK